MLADCAHKHHAFYAKVQVAGFFSQDLAQCA